MIRQQTFKMEGTKGRCQTMGLKLPRKSSVHPRGQEPLSVSRLSRVTRIPRARPSQKESGQERRVAIPHSIVSHNFRISHTWLNSAEKDTICGVLDDSEGRTVANTKGYIPRKVNRVAPKQQVIGAAAVTMRYGGSKYSLLV